MINTINFHLKRITNKKNKAMSREKWVLIRKVWSKNGEKENVEEGFGQSVHVGFIRLFSVRKRHGIIGEERGGGPVLHTITKDNV
jgi:hypothetical protein